MSSQNPSPTSESAWTSVSTYGLLWAVLITGCLWIFSRSAVAVDIVLCLLCIWALRGPYWALQSLALSAVIKYLNVAIVGLSANSAGLFWLVICFAAVRIFLSFRSRHLIRVLPVLIFSAVALLTSAFSSPALDVSIMKALSFAILVSAVVGGTDDLDEDQLRRLLSWLFSLGLTVLLLSLVTLIRPDIAFHFRGQQLRGIINHPQALGVISAPIAAALLSATLLEKTGSLVSRLALTGAVCMALALTQARTAAVAAIAGVAASLIASGISVPTRRREPYALRLALVLGLSACALAIAEYRTGEIRNAIESFVFKRGGASVEEAFLESRGLGILAEYQNFLKKPLSGNGFGVYPDGFFPSGVVRIGGFPISAPVEKGFLPTAVLEETGLFGGVALAYLLLSLAIPALKSPSLPLVAAFFACLIVNIGEENLLAPAGLGLYLWIFMGLAARKGRVLHPLRVSADSSAAERPINLPRQFPNLLQ
jgi:hypothetical protein